jgi:hypothetical protein
MMNQEVFIKDETFPCALAKDNSACGKKEA